MFSGKWLSGTSTYLSSFFLKSLIMVLIFTEPEVSVDVDADSDADADAELRVC